MNTVFVNAYVCVCVYMCINIKHIMSELPYPRILPGWPQLWPPFSLQGQSAATGIYLTQEETSHQLLFVGNRKKKNDKDGEIFEIFINLEE